MEYTKKFTQGKWEVEDRNDPDATCYFGGVEDLPKDTFPFVINMPTSLSVLGKCGAIISAGTIDKKEAEANANLIVSAVNACQSVNPDNLQAVAESIKDMYEALKMIYDLAKGYTEIPKDEIANALRPILAKAEGK